MPFGATVTCVKLVAMAMSSLETAAAVLRAAGERLAFLLAHCRGRITCFIYAGDKDALQI
jgi:hypothetical protein